MRVRLTLAAILALSAITVAQSDVKIAPVHPPAATAGPAAPGFPLPGGLNLPTGLFEQFWNDPALTADLHLTDVQRKQLQDATLAQRLALIDGGADALKALARLSAFFEADRLDDAGYKTQLNQLGAAVRKLVQDVGEMAVTPRRVLTAEQWEKLRSLQRANQAASKATVSRRPPAANAPPVGARP